MDLLILCHYGLYKDLSASFVHAQAKSFAALGNRVRVIIPIAYGKTDINGKKTSKVLNISIFAYFHNT